MKLHKEEQILDPVFRQKVIKEMMGSENLERKKEHMKRYEIYKDKTKQWVTKYLENEGLKPETVAQMSSRAANISLCRKVVDKLARTYAGAVERDGGDEIVTEQVSDLSRLLKFDEKMKKSDRYLELHRNNLIQVVPEPTGESDPDSEKNKYRLKMRVLAPWQYDVIEDANDNELMRVVILSDFTDEGNIEARSQYEAGVHNTSIHKRSDGVDNIIADDPKDKGHAKIVWWTKNYHFTTNLKGMILKDDGNLENLNPIGMLPFVNNADQQDGEFWAQGGDDLIEGSILVNKLMTDMFYIAYLQGYGQIVISGKNLKDTYQLGPNNAVLLEHDPDRNDPAPNFQIVSANPPLDGWMRMIEQYVALLLTTNNLSPGNISMKLDANQFPSGIAMLIEQSESTMDVSDKQKAYMNLERELWDIVSQWHRLYFETQELDEEFQAIPPLPEDLDLSVKFSESKPVITEKEKLELMKLKKDLGIADMLDLIKMDNPDLSDEAAEEKLLKLTEEKLKRAQAFALPSSSSSEDEDEQDEEQEQEE